MTRRANKARRKLATWTRLEPSLRNTVLEAWITQFQTTLQLRLTPYSWWRPALLEAVTPSGPEAVTTDAQQLQRLFKAFQISARNQPLKANCLRRSLALYRLLKRHRFPATVVIGSCLTDDRFQGHAWVEMNGRIVNDRLDVREQYQVIEFHRLEGSKLKFN